MQPPRTWAKAFLLGVVAALGCDTMAPEQPITHEGEVTGTVLRSDGTPLAAGARVTVTQCASPIGGYAGEDRTSDDGGFAVHVRVDAGREELESLACVVAVNSGTFARKAVDVVLRRRGESLVPTEVEIREGEGLDG